MLVRDFIWEINERVKMSYQIPTLSVIIVSWNVNKLLDDCLYSLKNALLGVEAETFVVDNASSDASPQMVIQKYPWVHLISNSENLGFGNANNQAIKLCRGKYLLLLNPDTIVPRGVIQAMISFLNDNQQAGLVGPEQCDTNGRINYNNLVHWSPRESGECLIERFASFGQRSTRILFPKPRQVPIINAGCWILRREAIDQVGLFDEDMFLFGEEYDYCRRLKRAGWEIWFLRDLKIIHYRRQSLRQIGLLNEIRICIQSLLIWLKKVFEQSLSII